MELPTSSDERAGCMLSVVSEETTAYGTLCDKHGARSLYSCHRRFWRGIEAEFGGQELSNGSWWNLNVKMGRGHEAGASVAGKSNTQNSQGLDSRLTYVITRKEGGRGVEEGRMVEEKNGDEERGERPVRTRFCW